MIFPMNKELIEIRSDPKQLFVYWMLTDYCNFNCAYCPKHLHDGRFLDLHPPLESLLQFCDKLNSFIANGKTIELVLGGGEPTTHKHLIEIIQRLDPKIWLTIITNGSRPLAWWKYISDKLDTAIISIHKESDIEKIDLNAKYLISENVDVVFNCTFDPDDWDDSVIRYNYFEKQYGNRRARKKLINEVDPITDRFLKAKPLTDIQRAFIEEITLQIDKYPDQWNKSIENHNNKMNSHTIDAIYSDNEQMTINKTPFSFKMVHHDLNHFYNWKCSAGAESISVDPRGVVSAGMCTIKKMGTIDNFSLFTDDVICNKITCIGLSDILISKKKS